MATSAAKRAEEEEALLRSGARPHLDGAPWEIDFVPAGGKRVPTGIFVMLP